MGCVTSTSDPNTAKSAEIDADLRKDRRNKDKTAELRLLVLGTGESGKSTLIRVLQACYGANEMSEKDTTKYNEILRRNVLESMKTILQAVGDGATPSLVQLVNEAEELTSEVAEAIEALSQEGHIKQSWQFRGELKIFVPDAAYYYFSNAKRIASEDWSLSTTDLAHMANKTTGIHESLITCNSIPCRLIDVGGQRSERRKWVAAMPDVTAVIFMISLSDYAAVLVEDGNTNRMIESLAVFKSVSSTEFLKDKTWILFFNKTDIFQSLIEAQPLSMAFPNCPETVKHDREEASKYIKKMYYDAFGGKAINLTSHFTCAVDPSSAKTVFMDVRARLVRNVLEQSNLI